jgi:hypothetical protein
MQEPRTVSKRLADVLLGQPVEEWLLQERAKGLSFRKIARELYLRTDGALDVSDQTLRTWLMQSAELTSAVSA